MKHVMHLAIPAALAALLSVTGNARLSAQSTSSLNFNIAAGAAFPTGDLGQFSDVGYNLTAGIGVKPRTSQIGFRAEGSYNEFSYTGGGASSHAGGVTANATFDLMNPTGTSSGTGMSLYAIGGIGTYDVGASSNGFNSASDWHFGYNIGGGLRFPLSGFSAYVEARYHSVSTNNSNLTFVPLVFGLQF